jgi:hypothetical protein
MTKSPEFFVGVDLGQARDYTAVAVIEGGSGYKIRHLIRERELTYPVLVDQIYNLMRNKAFRERLTTLVVDRTGVGAPIVDLLSEKGLKPVSITITGGDRPTNEEKDHWNVPKRDLIANLIAISQLGKLRIAAGLDEAQTLAEEFQNLRLKIDIRTSNESYTPWRESQHDDLVFAVALALWYAEKRPIRIPRPIFIFTGIGKPKMIWPELDHENIV